MKKICVLIVLLLATSLSLFAVESYLSLNYTPIFSKINMSYNGASSSSNVITSMFEIAGSSYWGHSGFVGKFRIGRIIKANDVSIEDSPIGYNSALGYSYITSINNQVDMVTDLLFMYMYDKSSGYVYGKSYTVRTFLGELHAALQLRLHVSGITSFNLGVDVGVPLFCSVKGSGYYSGQSYRPTITGYRVTPFVGSSIKVR